MVSLRVLDVAASVHRTLAATRHCVQHRHNFKDLSPVYDMLKKKTKSRRSLVRIRTKLLRPCSILGTYYTLVPTPAARPDAQWRACQLTREGAGVAPARRLIPFLPPIPPKQTIHLRLQLPRGTIRPKIFKEFPENQLLELT